MTTAVAAPVARMLHSLPAAAHIRALHHVGVTDREIIVRARIVNPQQLRRAARGESIGWDVERRLLALPIPNEASLHEATRSFGARRRLRALQALGWPLADLAVALGWPLHKVGSILAEHPISLIEHLAVATLYDQRWTWRPEDHGIPADKAEQTRLSAQIGQCASPLAWDDDAIDNAKARPRAGRADQDGRFGAPDPAAALRALSGDRVELSGRTRTLAIRHAARYMDMSFFLIAERLDMDYDSVKRSWERIKERARADGETWVDAPRFKEDAWCASWENAA